MSEDEGNQSVARDMWLCFEAYHDVTYFTPESRAATDALGCKGGWMGYYGMRAAPLGAAMPWQVASAFYNFHPAHVARSLPDAWRVAAPEEFLRTRLAGVDGALRRMLGDDVLAGPEIAEAADLARQALTWTPTAGRPLAAANAALVLPEEPHLALWQASTTLRESRGDGHVAALVSAGFDPCETLVAFAALRGLAPEYLRAARGWSDQEWRDAELRLAERGLVTADGSLTAEGKELRESVEDLTDEAAAAPWTELGDQGTSRLAELMAPLSLRIVRANDAMAQNPMAFDPEAGLARLSA